MLKIWIKLDEIRYAYCDYQILLLMDYAVLKMVYSLFLLLLSIMPGKSDVLLLVQGVLILYGYLRFLRVLII